MRRKIKIAIDGPAASGKSTTARGVARRLKYLYIDSGAMYRAVTLQMLEKCIDPGDAGAVAELAGKLPIRFRRHPQKTLIYISERDISEAIRTPDITRHIKPVAGNPEVRKVLVARQRELGAPGGIVMDGRDIGTVVFPDAELKIFMNADAAERARRRVEDLHKQRLPADFDTVLAELLQRDRDDATRSSGPLRRAADALEIDTTALSISEQIEWIYRKAKHIIDAQNE